MADDYTPTTSERKTNYPRTRKTRPAIDRFMERVDRSGDCWEWTARRFWDGYGIFYVGRSTVRAHRWSYEHFVGPIPEGLVIDHLCRNRACVNPAHLDPVTNRENVLRGTGPASRTECPHGHPYDEKNTRVAADGSRVCRTCHRVRQNKSRRAKMHHFTNEELAAHDAEVRKDERERVAREIEAGENWTPQGPFSCQGCPIPECHDLWESEPNCEHWPAVEWAARIARGGVS